MDSVVDKQLLEGEFTVEPWMAYLWADATRNTDDVFRSEEVARENGEMDQLVPPTLCLNIVLSAIDIDLDDLLRSKLDADFEKGVFHGGLEFDFDRPVYVNRTYQISGEIADVKRKRGTESEFDVVTIEFRANDEDDRRAFDVSTTILVMRGENDD